MFKCHAFILKTKLSPFAQHVNKWHFEFVNEYFVPVFLFPLSNQVIHSEKRSFVNLHSRVCGFFRIYFSKIFYTLKALVPLAFIHQSYEDSHSYSSLAADCTTPINDFEDYFSYLVATYKDCYS